MFLSGLSINSAAALKTKFDKLYLVFFFISRRLETFRARNRGAPQVSLSEIVSAILRPIGPLEKSVKSQQGDLE